jgi:hypothetical protein
MHQTLKKSLSFLLVVIMVVSLVSIAAFAAPADDFSYEVLDLETGKVRISVAFDDLEGEDISVTVVNPEFDFDSSDLTGWSEDLEGVEYIDQFTLNDAGKAGFDFTVKNAPVAGEYKIIFGTSAGSTYETFEIIEDNTPKIISDVVLDADPAVYVTGKNIIVTVTTSASVEYIGLFNESGKGMATLSKTSTPSVDGKTKDWVIVTTITSKGERLINVRVSGAGETTNFIAPGKDSVPITINKK